MEKRTPEKIDYIAHEAILCRQERTIKRLWITSLVLVGAAVVSNAAWCLRFLS